MNTPAPSPLPFVFGLSFRIAVRHHAGVDIPDPAKAPAALNNDASAVQEWLLDNVGVIAPLLEDENLKDNVRALALETLWVRCNDPVECLAFLRKAAAELDGLAAQTKGAHRRIQTDPLAIGILPPVGIAYGDDENPKQLAQAYFDTNISPYLDAMKEAGVVGIMTDMPPRSFAILDVARCMEERYLIQPYNRLPAPSRER